MNAQPSLIFDIPRSHHRDPESSFRAEHRVRKSGQMKTEAIRLLELIKQHPGMSTKELSQFGIERYAAARRASDLWRNGLILRGESKHQELKFWAILESCL